MKLLGFQASLGPQLTTLITHDGARITILEIYHVKLIIFLRQSTNYSQEIDCSFANFKFAFCNWNSRNSIIIKKKKKYKTKDKLWFCKGFASTAVYTVGHFDQMDPVFTIFLL